MKKNYTILILSIIATLASLFLLVFFLRVIENKNKHASLVLVTLEEKFKEKEDSILLADKISEIKELQDFIGNYFVDKNKIDTFVDYLEKIGSIFKTEVSVESIEVLEKDNNVISIKLSILGNFKEVMRTIAYVENIPYQVSIEQIYLNKDDNKFSQNKIKNQSSSMWQADVSFNVLTIN
ncbi:MAG TPA: hypothetical protein VK153_00900 [Candidatus Paceibacterota bacterium]|nr:hypothetical protein [Candidatus Paceibacterota bacterium]